MCKTISPKLRLLAIATCAVCCPLKLVPAALAGVAAISSTGSADFGLPLILLGWSCIAAATIMMLRTSKELAAPAMAETRSKSGD